MATRANTKHADNKRIDPMLPRLFRVDKIRKETIDTFTLELTPRESSDRISYEPGQFNMLYVFGVGEVPISISGDPATAPQLVHTTRVVGAVTRAMRNLKVGDSIGVRGPFGTSWPVIKAEGHDVVILAGGIGLAPLRPALYHILNNRTLYGKVVLLYGTRSPGDILFRKELEQWRSRFDLEVDVTVDYATDIWRGNVGVVTTLIPKAPFDPMDTIALTCGPEVMMRFCAAGLVKRGLPIENIYLSMERNMKCAIGLCGHCQMGNTFICKDGPVFPYDQMKPLLTQREI